MEEPTPAGALVIEILVGDCRERLRDLPAGHFHTVVTSPPYFGLRDYGTAEWEGGDPACGHIVAEMRTGADLAAWSAVNGRGGAKKAEAAPGIQARDVCPHCDAVRVDSQIGLEETPEAFVAALVEVFREIRRVLRDDGTVWLNLGDSYARSPTKGGSGAGGKNALYLGDSYERSQRRRQKSSTAGPISGREGYAERPAHRAAGLAEKQLLGIPWRVAFALQADGWFLRQEVIWSKPNPMPESVLDRCTKAHEQVFLLSKSGDTLLWRARDTREWSEAPDLTERLPAPTEEDPHRTVGRWRGFDYFFDAEAIAEPAIYAPDRTTQVERPKGFYEGKRNDGGAKVEQAFKAIRETRNKRSVWTVAPKGFDDAHFATMPPDLALPCILAGCPAGGFVLDPFGGAGTTALVAEGLGRNATIIELNPGYAEMAAKRIRGGQEGLFTRVEVR